MTAEHPSDTLALAARFRARLEAKDVTGFVELFEESATVWRNFDRRTLNRRQLGKVITFLVAVEGLRYEDVRVQPTASGWVQQHRLCGVTPGGAALDVDVCLVVKVRDGRIEHLDEYLDSEAMRPLL